MDRLDAGEDDREDRAAVVRVAGCRGAVVLFDNALDDREAKPAARLAAGAGASVEAIKDVREVCLVDPGPVVTDPQSFFRQGNFDDLACRGVSRGIVEQVVDRLGELFGDGVGDDRFQIGVERDLGAVAASAGDGVFG